MGDQTDIHKPPAGVPPLLALGFRPFYLLAGIYGALSVPLWLVGYFALWPVPPPHDPAFWHNHEMIFGFAAAVIGGFLFTAVRNWTGRQTPTGWPLAAIAALWLAARSAQFVSNLLPVALVVAVDAGFLLVLAAAVGRPILAARNRRNYVFPLILIGMAAVAAIHTWGQDLRAIGGTWGAYAALDLVLLLLAIVAGRVVPAFTRTGVPGARIRQRPWVERAAIGLIALVLAGDLLGLAPTIMAAAALVAGLANAFRLAGWDTHAARGRPILWILHLGYLWIVAALVLRAGESWSMATAPVASAHAIGVGAMGTFTLAMMTRSALGHTGRALHASRATVSAYLAVSGAAVLRIVAVFAAGDLYFTLILGAGALWTLAFLIFTVEFWPILTRARIDGRPG